MLPFQDRYSRQRKLPEVGKRGQQRIEALHAVVQGGPEALVELAYLERAGVRQLELRETSATEASPSWPHSECFAHPGPRNVALGAWGALRRIRQALEAQATPTPSNEEPRDPS